MIQGCACGRPCAEGEQRCASCLELPGTQPFLKYPPIPKTSAALFLQPGTLLGGKWRIESLLGHGGMGAVYLATDTALLRPVAVKVLTGALAMTESFAVRFQREAQLLASLDHPNIVPVYSVGEHEGRPFFVMKRLLGGTLGERLRTLRSPVDVELLRSWMKQVCSALQVVHTMGVVHRDLKPANLWIDSQEHVTVLDFGISHHTQVDATTRRVLGSPAYMSPEQIKGQRVTPAADVYALGVLTFQVLTGTLPFQGDNDFELAQQHVSVRAPDCRETAPWIGRQVAAVIARALSKDPLHRYPFAQPFFDALDEALTADAQASRNVQWLLANWWKHRRQVRIVTWAAVGLVAAMATAGGWATKTPAPVVPVKTEPPPTPMAEVALGPALFETPPANGVTADVVVRKPLPVTSPAFPRSRPVKEKSRSARRTQREAPEPSETELFGAPGELRVMTTHAGQPTWGTLWVDGKARGSTPARIRVEAGEHQLRIERPGFKVWSQDIQVGAGKPLSLKIELVADLTRERP